MIPKHYTPAVGERFKLKNWEAYDKIGVNQMEGQVSLGGKKYSAFTSSQLFEREDGSLVDVGVIFVRMSDPVNKKE